MGNILDPLKVSCFRKRNGIYARDSKIASTPSPSARSGCFCTVCSRHGFSYPDCNARTYPALTRLVSSPQGDETDCNVPLCAGYMVVVGIQENLWLLA